MDKECNWCGKTWSEVRDIISKCPYRIKSHDSEWYVFYCTKIRTKRK